MHSMTTASLWSILFAGVVALAIGFVWFHPKVFGSAWMRLAGISPEQAAQGKRRMPAVALIGLLANMLIAYVMSFMMPVLVYPDWIGAIELGLWCWLGFVAPVMLGMVLWERKSFKLYLINSLYWLVSFIAIALMLLLPL